MAWTTTIDGAGRLVLPKRLRVRLHLVPGCTLHITESEGRVVICADLNEPRLVERGDFLGIDVGPGALLPTHTDVRNERLQELVEFALRR